jgi:hypothetical protein
MKILSNIIKLIFLLGAASYFRINANATNEIMVSKKELPYEILNISLQDNSIVINGWVLISYKQHYLNSTDHKTIIEFYSISDSFRVDATLTNLSLTNQMQYFGSPKCSVNSINQIPEICNYNYENVGFKATIPLNMFKIDQTYQTNIISHAYKANLQYKTPIYYPMKKDLNFKLDEKEYNIVSRLDDTELKVNATTVIARKQPSKISAYWYSGTNCSSNYKNQLFFLINSTYQNVFDRVLSNETSYYQVKAKSSVCDGPRRRIVEGNNLSPVWIASTYVLYSGTPLQINAKYINRAPYFDKNDIYLYKGQKLEILDHIKAIDPEEGDISYKIEIIDSDYKDEVGQYSVKVKVSDKEGLTSHSDINVYVLALPNSKPIIYAENIRILQYSDFKPLDYARAYDNEDGDLTNSLISLNNVDTSIISIQEQCYYVEDSNGLNDSKCVEVEVFTNKDFYNKFRLISKNNLFYKEETPNNWINIYFILTQILNIE